MKHYDDNIIRLIQLYLVGGLSKEEEVKLEEWLRQDPSREKFMREIREGQNVGQNFSTFENVNKDLAWGSVVRKGRIEISRSHRLGWYKFVAAVMVPLMIIGAAYYMRNYTASDQQQSVEIAEITPGKGKAILRLNDNRVIELSTEQEKQLDVAKGVAVKSDASGMVYPDQGAAGVTEYNVLEVPRGGEYTVTLSDGTVVYLNSGSTLRYPVAFGADLREVSFSGEAYFEVAKDAERPFYVVVDDMKIKVYGTSFNVNTHYTGKVQTVLVEGKIGIETPVSGKEYEVSPGQMALYNSQEQTMNINSVDVRPYVAWKDRVFAFEKMSLEDIMTTLSLWYDVDVFYQTSSLRSLHFTGHLGRYEDISTILDAISGVTRVNFTVKGRAVIVSE